MEKTEVSVFCSYSHKDEELKNTLINHLAPLLRQKIITEWHDRKILPGQEWEKEIDEKIKTADLILLLISSDFIASDYCFDNELSIALDRHDTNSAVVVPIILRPTDWHDMPFSKIQSLPHGAIPITKWENSDEACLDITNGIKKVIQDIIKFKNRSGERAGLLSMHDVLSKEVNRLDDAFNRLETQVCSGIPTGLHGFDLAIDGLHPAELIVIASRPAMGKTALALNIASHIALVEKKSVAYFSINSPAETTTRRLISMIGSINNSDLLRGNLSDDEWPRLTSAITLLADAPIFIDESVLMSIDELREKLILFKEQHNLKAVFIDSLQDIAYKEKSIDKNISYSEYAHKLKHLAREINLPIVVTVSLPRNVELRANKRPLNSDLSEFDSLINCADVVSYLYRRELYDDFNFMDENNSELIVAKNNNGLIGTIKLAYDTKYSSFSNTE